MFKETRRNQVFEWKIKLVRIKFKIDWVSKKRWTNSTKDEIKKAVQKILLQKLIQVTLCIATI